MYWEACLNCAGGHTAQLAPPAPSQPGCTQAAHGMLCRARLEGGHTLSNHLQKHRHARLGYCAPLLCRPLCHYKRNPGCAGLDVPCRRAAPRAAGALYCRHGAHHFSLLLLHALALLQPLRALHPPLRNAADDYGQHQPSPLHDEHPARKHAVRKHAVPEVERTTGPEVAHRGDSLRQRIGRRGSGCACRGVPGHIIEAE